MAKNDNQQPNGRKPDAEQNPPGAPSATQNPNPGQIAKPSVVQLLLAVIAVLAIVAAFFVGRTTAPNNCPATAGGGKAETNAAQSTAPADPDFPMALAPQTDKRAVDLLRSFPRRDSADERAMGRADAPVVFSIFSDYSCPYCALFAQQIFGQLMPLVEDGTVRVEWNDLVMFQEYGSDVAAAGGVAAAKQGKFWEFNREAFGTAPLDQHAQYTQESVIALAQKVGMPNIEQFKADLTSQDTQSILQQSTGRAQSAGISGAPAFMVNDVFISGITEAQGYIDTIKAQAKAAKAQATTVENQQGN